MKNSLAVILFFFAHGSLGLSFFNSLLKASPKSSTSRQEGLEESALLAARSGDDTDFLRAIEVLEETLPTPNRFVEDPVLAAQLAGTWELVGTLAATVGQDLNATAKRGVVNASGIVVDADAESNKPLQIIDIDQALVRNEVRLKAPIVNKDVIVCVSGRFAPEDRKVNVDFEELEILDATTRKSIFKNRFLFSVIRTVNRELINGDQEKAWLETTYLSDRLRVGRGNKGSCFLLEKKVVTS